MLNQNKRLSRAVEESCAPQHENFKAEGKVLREENEDEKNKSVEDRLTIHLCWKAIPLADSFPWTKTLEYDLLALVRS